MTQAEPEWWAEARKLRADGFGWRRLGKIFRKHRTTVREACDDAYRTKKREERKKDWSEFAEWE